MIKRSRYLFALLKSRSRWVLSFDSTHTPPTPCWQSRVEALRLSDQGPDQILAKEVEPSKPDEIFEELYSTAERHDKQYSESVAGRGDPQHKPSDRMKKSSSGSSSGNSSISSGGSKVDSIGRERLQHLIMRCQEAVRRKVVAST